VLALIGGASCSRSPDQGQAAAGADAGADAAAAAAAAPVVSLPEGVKACGNPAATPRQVVHEFLTASKERNVEGMLACFKPKHRERMAGRAGKLEELTALSFTVGEERIDGDAAEVQAEVQRYDGRGLVEYKRDPIRLERQDGVWYFK
jgi:hypothetical protein